MMPPRDVHDAHPYGCSAPGSPPIQCVSTSVAALRRDHLADSARISQFALLSNFGVTYISCSCVPVPKYDRISDGKSFCRSVWRSFADRAKMSPCIMSELIGNNGPRLTTFAYVSASR